MRKAPSRRPAAPAAARLLLGATLLGAALLGVSACGHPDDGPDLLNDLATRLDRAGDLTFTAEYRLGDGGLAVLAQAQQPRRAAYVHPGGKAVSTETQLAECWESAAGTRCTLDPPPSPGTDPVLDLLAAAQSPRDGMVTPTVVMRLLSTAVLDGSTVTRYQNTIAGEPATCVGVHGSAGFTACVTARGLLGNFTGTVDGTLINFELTEFETTADAHTFELPAGAAIDDRRADAN
jgi:hypothetical protein